MKIGFIGLGIMGKPMAKNLLNAGMKLMVSDLNKDAVNELVSIGAEQGTYAEIGAQCDIVITMLPNGQIVQDVLFGPGGVAENLASGKLVCDMSSVTPEQSRECYRKLKKSALAFLTHLSVEENRERFMELWQ